MAHALMRAVSRLFSTSCLLALACLPSLAGAAETCPWLNVATASGFLGAHITSSSVRHAQSNDDATCEFISAEGSLAVAVQTMPSPAADFPSYLARCHSPAEPLQAIGNKAVVCSDAGAQQVIGRVRNRAFVIRIKAPGRDLREKARKVAEQVAGILF
ncbi:MAG: hypothetical protein ABSF54_16365 [Bryobacteraceae bacterium]